MGRSALPESGEVLTHQLLNFRKTGIARTPSMTGMMAYLGDEHTLLVDTVITLTCHKYHVIERTQTRSFEE